MKLTVSRGLLLSALGVISEIMPNSARLASPMMVMAQEGALYLLVWDGPAHLTAKVPCEVNETGRHAVDALRLISAAKSMPDGQIEFSFTSDKVALKGGRSRVSLPVMSVMPPQLRPDTASSAQIKFRATEIIAGYDRVDAFVETRVTNHALTGIFIHAHEGRIRMVGCDGKRLAFYEIDNPAAQEFAEKLPGGCIVGAQSMAVIRKMAARDDMVTMMCSENLLSVTVSDCRFVTQLITGPYPNYIGVIPASQAHRVSINRRDMLSAIRSAASVLRDESGLKFDIRPTSITVTGTSKDGSESVVDIEAEADCEMGIFFNHKFLARAIETFEGDTVSVGITSDTVPATLLGSTNGCIVVMPMRGP